MKKSVSTKKKVIRAAVILGVIIIPLMYSFFYLSAFWDPYKKLDQLPIALVNNDKGAMINNENRNLGKDFVKELEKDGSFKYTITDSEDAKKGTEASDYYAMIVIPEDFSSDIASASETKKQTASIVFSPNEKRNYLASQILSRAEIEMETSLREQISGEIVGSLTDQVAKVPDQLGTLNDGLVELSDGSSKLLNGTQTLVDGTQTLDSGSQKLKTGSEDLAAGTQTLADGSETLVAGTDTLAAGTSEFASKFSAFNAGMGTLESGSEQVNAGAEGLVAGTEQLNQGIQGYTAGVDTLISNVNQTSLFIGSFVQEHPELMADPAFAAFIQNMSSSDNADSIAQLKEAGSQISAASDSIATGTQVLAQGTGNLNEGIAMVSVASGQLNSAADSISTGASDVANGATSLKSGATALSKGATTLNNGVTSLASGTSSLVDGATTLADGQQQLNSGIDTAQSGVKTAVDDAHADSAKLNGLSDFVSAPVNVENNIIDPIPNYGTYFTPYFLSLSLWVGALIIFFGIYFDADGKFEILSRDSTQKIKRSFIYLLIGFGQAIALGVAIRSGLGLEVNNVGFYFVSICLVSLVSIAIVQFCIVHMGDFGKLAAIALLIFQLTSCGGTFPMETLPKFFNVLYPYMPMTYAVVLFKESISGTITGVFWHNFIILGIFLIVFFGGTIVLSAIKKRKRQRSEKKSKIDFTPKEQY